MIHGFLKVCAATPKIKVADCEYNGKQIRQIIEDCEKQEIKVVVFPELCLTGYTCGDLFLQEILLESAKDQLFQIVEYTTGKDILAVIGLPYRKKGKLFNVAAVIQNGVLLGMVPKTNLPNYSEFYEARHFNRGNEEVQWLKTPDGTEFPFGSKLLFSCENMEEFVLGVEICEDVWVPVPPSSLHALAGATLIANLSASDEITGKDSYRIELVKSQSARLVCGYIYSDAGEGESTTDLVFAGHNIIAENGTALSQSERFQNQSIVSEIDFGKLISERRRMTTYQMSDLLEEGYEVVDFSFPVQETELTRKVERSPFVPYVKHDRDMRCHEILSIQAMGLKKRLEHTGSSCAVIGISGGLDSTLAFLVTVKAFDLLGLKRENILAVTMPCFGTTDRTYNNAVSLIRQLGATLREIPIKDAVSLHFKDIGQDPDKHDITYENAQARERTQILMNLANKNNGMVVGTGDMSELALGWATYNGDHMSMYGVNSSVPKTLVRYLVLYYAETAKDPALKEVLLDVLDTPVSPELLPPKDGIIAQKTEDIVGPYELHDFFLYYILRFGFSPAKVYRLAVYAFEEEYGKDTIYKWLNTFYRRFFSQQFKRSCLPDGPKVGTVAVSPRGDLRMPSDASAAIWLKELESLKE